MPFAGLFKSPSRQVEWLLWMLVIVATLGIRLYLIHLLPIALWSKDTSSYIGSALTWVHSGVWESDPRRGAIYSLFIGLCTKGLGSVHAVMVCQHVLGALAIFATLAAARCWLGKKAAVPLALCGLAYGIFDLPIHLEHLLRNETLLFFFGSLTFASWLLALHRGQARWLWITGISAALLTLTKNVYAPFPLLLVGGHLFFFRADLRAALKQVMIFAVAFALPFAGVKALDSFSPRKAPPAPQDGILFYGRTAQFTVLDGGRHPEIKAAIRQEVEDYRKLPKRDNNIVIHRTVVPHLQRILSAEGKLPADVNRLCWELGVEGVKANPEAYLRQVRGDLYQVLFTCIRGSSTISKQGFKSVKKTLETLENQDPLLDIPGMIHQLSEAARGGKFGVYYNLVALSWLFHLVPAVLTTLLLPCFFWRARGALRLWWFGLAGVWFFNVVLLCTVGRPLNRYLIPVVPIMFWTLSAGFVFLWGCLSARFGSQATPERLEPIGKTV